MLIAIGPGVTALQDYTNISDYRPINIHSVQGDTLDEFNLTVHDATSTLQITAEDDIVALDENDPAGWPGTNLVQNPGLSGSYSAGVPPSWTGQNVTATGVSISKGSTNPIIPGGNYLKITCTNVASGTNINYLQVIKLPQDETGDAIRDPMILSGWVRYDSAWVGNNGGPNLQLTWFDINQADLGSVFCFPFINSAQTNVWVRGKVSATPPANAFYAKVTLTQHVNAASITGSAYFEAIQLEYETFASVLLNNPAPPILNKFLACNNGNGTADDWERTSQTGASFTNVATPGFNQTAQQITIANMTVNQNANIQQSGRMGGLAKIPINPNAAYQATMTYQVTTAFVNAKAQFNLNCLDSGGNYLSTLLVYGPQDEALSGGGLNYKQLLIPCGPGTGTDFPDGTAMISFAMGITSTNATNSGVIAIAKGDMQPYDISQQLNPSACYITALQAGMYPSPYCDAGITGVYLDSITNCYFRQLRLFGGFCRTVNYDYTTEPESDMVIKAVDYGVLLQEAPATLLIAAQNDNAAISAACLYAVNKGHLEGLDYTTFVQNISTIDSMIFNWRTTRDVLTEISNHTVAAYYVDYYKRLHYEPALATVAPFGVSDNPDYVTTFPFERWQYTDDSTQSDTTPVIEGSTQLSAPQTYSTTGNGTNKIFTPNGGSSIQQLDTVTVGGVAKVIGLANVNTYSQGYDALLDPNAGILTFNVAPGNAVAVVIIFRYTAPVIVQLHAPSAESKTITTIIKTRRHGKVIKIRRKVHVHIKVEHLGTKQAAIDQANAHLAQYAQPRPVGKFVLRTPPAPVATTLRTGMAIPITHALSGLSSTLFQIQEITLRPMGNGQIVRECAVGYYRPDFMIQMMHANRQLHTDTAELTGTALVDVLSLSDGWAMTDAITHTVANVGNWNGPSTWDGTGVWI